MTIAEKSAMMTSLLKKLIENFNFNQVKYIKIYNSIKYGK